MHAQLHLFKAAASDVARGKDLSADDLRDVLACKAAVASTHADASRLEIEVSALLCMRTKA